MLFHTWTFLAFFIVVWCVYLALRRTPFAMLWLLLASYVFYAGGQPLFLGLIIYSTLVDYVAVEGMARTGRKKTWLAVSLINNLGMLAFFKYAHFALDNLDLVLSQFSVQTPLPRPGFDTMVVGISFYTFQSLSYTIDFYRGRIPRETNPLRFFTYVAFFPQLVAGPIERSEALLPQLNQKPPITRQHLTTGASLFLTGWFKKVALADQLRPIVESVYSNPDRYAAPDVIVATFAFAWQIYFDFSGYSDMARGVARWMGFELMVNFRHPYLAESLSDFWSRWHISLSQWFRDYVYIPLGGNRAGAIRWALNIMLVFIVSGLWHGAAWTFVLWGAWHGIGLVLLRPLERRGIWKKVPRALQVALIFVWVLIAWAVFRAESLEDLKSLALSLGNWSTSVTILPWSMGLMIAAVWLHQMLNESRWKDRIRHWGVSGALALAMLVYLWLLPTSSTGEFIYFQF